MAKAGSADIAAIVLAAGRASRFGAGAGESKVLAAWAGLPLVRHVAARALASRAAPVLVVTGNAEAGVRAALDDLPVTLVANADWASGMAGSLKAGIAALPARARGALVMLGDMPLVAPATLDRLIDAFDSAAYDAVVPVRGGRAGNPALIGRAMFDAIGALNGDEGARKLLAEPHRRVARLAVDDPGVLVDVDTREALAALPARRR